MRQLVSMRHLFGEFITVVGLHIPRKKTMQYLKKFKPFLLSSCRMRCVQPCTDPSKRLVLLNVEFAGREPDLEFLRKTLDNDEAEIFLYRHRLGYDQLTIEQVLRKLLPSEIKDIPTGFELVGCVVHLNLKPPCLPYRHLIGRVMLDKIKGARCVINKKEPIQSQFRTPSIEVLAGENNTNVQLVSFGAIFRFDYAKVYWNGRLGYEHARIANICSSTDPHNGAFPVILDAFAGVGPFSILAAKRGCFVYANDLNLHGYKYLVRNSRLNRVDHSVLAYNLDAIKFIRHFVGDNQIRPDHIIMNFPDKAVEMLAVFRQLYPPEERRLPFIHCYSFSSDDVSAWIGRVLCVPIASLEVRSVKHVSPTKALTCVSFKLPGSIERRGSADAIKRLLFYEN